jgi:hypothetical protein
MKKKTIWATFVAASVCGAAAQVLSPTAQTTSPMKPKVLIDSLAPAEIDEAIRLLKSNFIDPNALKDQEISRATLEGLLKRLQGGAILLPANGNGSPNPAAPFYSEVLNNHIGYLRIGSLTNDNLRELDKALANFAAKRVDAVVIDLRASTSMNEFDVAAEVTKRFVAKGKALWTLHKTSVRQDRAFSNERDPAFQGITMVLIDGETSGAAEPIAAALKAGAQGLLIGQPTAGCAVEYSDFPLGGGTTIRVAVGEILSSDGHSLFPGGVKPDLPVETPVAQKRQIFLTSTQKGIASFVFETERPHFNEAALMAGTNPELEARQQRRNPEENLHDPVLQRAVDVIASVAIFQKR